MTMDIFGPEYAMPALTRAEVIALVVRQFEQPHEPGQVSIVVNGDEDLAGNAIVSWTLFGLKSSR